MSNPFEVIDKRLSNIEELLLSIKHPTPLQALPPNSSDQEFTIAGLAAYLKRSKATIHSYKRGGVFPFYQTGRTVYFKKSEVDAALNSKQKRS